jgi:hypothetical protein
MTQLDVATMTAANRRDAIYAVRDEMPAGVDVFRLYNCYTPEVETGRLYKKMNTVDRGRMPVQFKQITFKEFIKPFAIGTFCHVDRQAVPVRWLSNSGGQMSGSGETSRHIERSVRR